MEQLDYNRLFRWFVGMSADEGWVGADIVCQESRAAAEARHRGKPLRTSAEAGRAAPVGRTLRRRWHAGRDVGVAEKLPAQDSVDDGDGANFHATQRKNDTHQSTSDPDAKLYRKSRNAESKLSGATAGRLHARVRGSSSGDGEDGVCIAQFGEPGSGPSQRRTVEIAARARWDTIEIGRSRPMPAALQPAIVYQPIIV
jgi:hypothetical protein